MDKFIHYNCNNGQSVFDALEQLKSDGKVPSGASVGGRYSFGDEKTNSAIIGEITDRRDEMFAIVLK